MSIWYCSSHNEQMTYIAGLDLAGHVIPPAHAVVGVALELAAAAGHDRANHTGTS